MVELQRSLLGTHAKERVRYQALLNKPYCRLCVKIDARMMSLINNLFRVTMKIKSWTWEGSGTRFDNIFGVYIFYHVLRIPYFLAISFYKTILEIVSKKKILESLTIMIHKFLNLNWIYDLTLIEWMIHDIIISFSYFHILLFTL